MVRKFIYSVCLILTFSATAIAQQVAVIDIADILSEMKEYKEAEDRLDKIASEWRQDIAQEYDKIKSMYNKLQAEQVLLSEDVKKQRQESIIDKEKEVRELQRIKFGPEGELFLRRQELINPIQQKVYSAIEDYAAERGLDIILDKGGSAGVLFTSEEYDKTQTIKRRLGIR